MHLKIHRNCVTELSIRLNPLCDKFVPVTLKVLLT